MNHLWQLQEAKSKFSEVVERALVDGPQVITRHGKEVVMIISCADYRKMTMPAMNLYEFFRTSPLVGSDIDLTRIDSPLPAPLEL